MRILYCIRCGVESNGSGIDDPCMVCGCREVISGYMREELRKKVDEASKSYVIKFETKGAR